MPFLKRIFEILFVWSTRLVAFGLVSSFLFFFGFFLIVCVPSLFLLSFALFRPPTPLF